jgi:hypothetical protein
VALDEGRFGLITWLRRRWCPLGERPPWIVQEEYEWVWLYAAMDPTTGTGVFLLLPTVEGACLELFLQHLRHELGDGPIGVCAIEARLRLLQLCNATGVEVAKAASNLAPKGGRGR